jgi:hypothetical protein
LKNCACAILVLALARAVRAVEHASLPDLQEELAVVCPLLDDAVAVAGEPHIVLAIDEAAVDGARHGVGIAPRIDQVAREVENEHRGCLQRRFRFLLGDVAAVGDHQVIVSVNADAACSSDDPPFGQRLGPPGIDLELRPVALCPQRR